MKLRMILLSAAALTLSACGGGEGENVETPDAEPQAAADAPTGIVIDHPMEYYTCGETRLAVRLLGAAAEVSENGGETLTLPALGEEGTTYTNGARTLFIQNGAVSWAVARAAAQPCVTAPAP